MRSKYDEKSETLRTTRRELNELKTRCLELEDENQTNKQIVRDKMEKLERARHEHQDLRGQYEEDRVRWQQSNDQMQREIDGARAVHQELMDKLKSVCAGYQRMKKESTEQIEALQRENEQRSKTMEQKMETMMQEIEGLKQRERTLLSTAQQNEMEKKELTSRLDCVIQRNSKLNHKYKQSSMEIEQLHQKLAETQKLAAMISGLMSSNADNKT